MWSGTYATFQMGYTLPRFFFIQISERSREKKYRLKKEQKENASCSNVVWCLAAMLYLEAV
jgi:hypothetical protein